MKQLPEKFSVYAATLEEAKYITKKQRELYGNNQLAVVGYYYRFEIGNKKDYGYSKQSYLTYPNLLCYNIKHEFTCDEFKSYFEEEFVLPEKWIMEVNNQEEFDEFLKWAVNEHYFNNLHLKAKDYEIPYYCYFDEGSKSASYNHKIIWEAPKITFEQFKKHVLKQKTIEKKIIGYKVKEQYVEFAIKLVKSIIPKHKWLEDKINFSVYDSTWLPKFEKAGVLDLWFEPIYSQKEQNIILSNNKSVKIKQEGVEVEGKIVKIKYIEDLFCNENTFGDTGWNIQYNAFNIGCYKNLTREDLNKILEHHKEIVKNC